MWWLLPLLQLAGARGGFVDTQKMNCGGAGSALGCNLGKTTDALHYQHMGDEDMAACEQKCLDLGCPCFDFAGVGSSPRVRKGERCRICAAGAVFLPLQSSAWGYEAQVYEPSSWGWPFLLFVSLPGGLYLAAGYLYNSRAKGLRGSAALPHAVLWMELSGLVADGITLARGQASARRGGGGVYVPIKAGREKEKQRKKGPSSKAKETSGGKKEKKKEKENARETDPSVPETSAAGPSASAARPAVAAAAGTSAGDGGRWVHVPS